MGKIISTGMDARESIFRGIEKLYSAVGSTLGPGGNTVVIERPWGSPIITKDGVTVANNISFDDQYENLGVNIVSQVAKKTDEIVGDGTTTATVLAYNIYKACKAELDNGENLLAIKKSLLAHKPNIVKYIEEKSKPTTADDIYNIAMVSSNADEGISSLIKTAFEAVGHDGHITVDVSNTMESFVSVTSGMEFNTGYLSSYFAEKDGECVMKDAMVLLCGDPIVMPNEILPAMKIAMGANRPLLVIAPNVNGEALGYLTTNRIKRGFNCCAVKVPVVREMDVAIEDLSVITGATIVSFAKGLKASDVKPEHLGTVKKVTVSRKTMTFNDVGDREQNIKEHIQMLSEGRSKLHQYELAGFDMRIRSLSSKVATIYVGGRTELEANELKDRVDDATFAVRSAIDGGTVVGAGMTLYEYSKTLGDDVGGRILSKALKAPHNLIMSNLGLDPEKYPFNGEEGYNLATLEKGNLRSLGVLDPTKVTASAIMNALSIVDVLLSTNVVLINSVKDPKNEGQIAEA